MNAGRQWNVSALATAVILFHFCNMVQEISNSSTMGARPSDLAILSTAASQLFESTRDMSTDAVTSIMAALREVSSKMTPEAAKQPGQLKYASQSDA